MLHLQASCCDLTCSPPSCECSSRKLWARSRPRQIGCSALFMCCYSNKAVNFIYTHCTDTMALGFGKIPVSKASMRTCSWNLVWKQIQKNSLEATKTECLTWGKCREIPLCCPVWTVFKRLVWCYCCSIEEFSRSFPLIKSSNISFKTLWLHFVCSMRIWNTAIHCKTCNKLHLF